MNLSGERMLALDHCRLRVGLNRRAIGFSSPGGQPVLVCGSHINSAQEARAIDRPGPPPLAFSHPILNRAVAIERAKSYIITGTIGTRKARVGTFAELRDRSGTNRLPGDLMRRSSRSFARHPTDLGDPGGIPVRARVTGPLFAMNSPLFVDALFRDDGESKPP